MTTTQASHDKLYIGQLCDSIAAGDVAMVGRLVKLAKQNLNACFYGLDGGMTPLMHACRTPHLTAAVRRSIVAILLLDGVDVNLLSRGGVADGFTRVNALWLAARNEDVLSCQLLMDNGALLCPSTGGEAQFVLKLITEGFVKKYAALFKLTGMPFLPKDLQAIIFHFLKRLHLYHVCWDERQKFAIAGLSGPRAAKISFSQSNTISNK